MISLMLPISLAFGVDSDSADKFFTTSIRPILSAKCLECHSAARAEGGLRLDSRAALLKGGERGPAISTESPKKSLLLTAIHRSDKDLQMPPSGKLTPTEIEHLERWIKEGACWPASTAPLESDGTGKKSSERIGDAWTDQRNPIVKIFRGQRLDLWSFQPVRKTKPPTIKSVCSGENPIDAYVDARRQAAGIGAIPLADRRILIRRLSFDLIGLPPTPEEVSAFLNDESPTAYEKVVDRLLASPRFGEHWGRNWLDVVRYSDSNGFDWDEFRPAAWRFRDYVIRSFNDDKPLDRIIHEHLAGDELIAGPPKDCTEQDALIATGFLRLGPQDNSAPLFNEQARARTEVLSDLVETTGVAFLGLSFSCCRCHDHKHDPLSQADYYRFRAFFESVKYGDDVSIDLKHDQDRNRRRNDEIDRNIKEVQTKIDRLTSKTRDDLRRSKIAKLSANEKTKFEKADKGDKERQKLQKKVEPTADEIKKALSERERTELETLEKRVAELKSSKSTSTVGLIMVEGEGTPPATHVLGQGDYRSPKQAVLPGIPSAFDPNDLRIERCEKPKSSGRRTTLAKWITTHSNPLTNRVFVNRVWQGLFGRGLVATPDDFGYAGAKPHDRELLDWLATEFVEQGWSIKRLLRRIVTSRVYQESSRSAGDSEEAIRDGRRLRRLSAEQLRDALLQTSGLMHPKRGGPPSWPDLPVEILQANPAFLDDNATKTKGWYPSPIHQQYCRSIYLVQKRTLRVPFMESFDLPENTTCCGKRNVSIVAPQALSLMNSPLTQAVCTAFAKRIERQVGDDPDHQIEAAFRLAFQRSATQSERTECRRFLMSRRSPDLCRALVNLNEFIYLD
jgi:hypothetical protein